MADVIVALIVIGAVGAAVMYIRREKKCGVKCIGCPYASECAQREEGGCGTDTKKAG